MATILRRTGEVFYDVLVYVFACADVSMLTFYLSRRLYHANSHQATHCGTLR